MNIGIIGTSDISTKSVLPYVNEQISVVAVASRSYERAKEFSLKYHIPLFYQGYMELLRNPIIDSVYIALPPAFHFEWICNSLIYGKNILVEKPMCLTKDQFKQIGERIKNKNIFLLEGLMIRHHPWLKRVKEIVYSKRYGNPVRCVTNISMKIASEMENGFRADPTLGGGVVIDEAPYWLCILQNIFDEEISNINGKILDKKNNTVWSAEISAESYSLEHRFYCSYNDKYSSDLYIDMELATLCVKNFFRASMGDYKIVIQIQDSVMKDKIIFPPQNYYRNQLMYFKENMNNEDIKRLSISEAGIRAGLLEKVLTSL